MQVSGLHSQKYWSCQPRWELGICRFILGPLHDRSLNGKTTWVVQPDACRAPFPISVSVLWHVWTFFFSRRPFLCHLSPLCPIAPKAGSAWESMYPWELLTNDSGMKLPENSTPLLQIRIPLRFNQDSSIITASRWLRGKESAYQCRRHRFDPWVGKIPWRREW